MNSTSLRRAPCNLPLVAATFLAVVGSGPSTFAQSVGGQWESLHTFSGNQSGHWLGRAVAGVGDLDGDGLSDVIVGAPFAGAGTATVYSGGTGAVIHSFQGGSFDDRFGTSAAAAGDIDGDGVGDLLIGAPDASPGSTLGRGAAYLVSGASGTLIRRFQGIANYDSLGWSVANAGDVNGDGVPDQIIGAIFASASPVAFGPGGAFVYSGANGALLWSFFPPGWYNEFGSSVAGAGDVDGDGFADLIVGAPFTVAGGVWGEGAVFVYSGASGTLLWSLDGANGDFLGTSVTGIGDRDGDGLDDIAVGATGADSGGILDNGMVYLRSGLTGALISEHHGVLVEDGLGGAVASVEDADGDGVGDLLVGAPGWWSGLTGPTRPGFAVLYSGATGDLLWRSDGDSNGDAYGSSVADAGDVDGDGLSDLIVGAYDADPGGALNAGSALIFGLDPFLHLDADSLSLSGSGQVQFDIDFPSSEAGARYIVLASASGVGPTVLSGVEVPLTVDSVLLYLTGGGNAPMLQGSRGTLDSSGNATAILTPHAGMVPLIGTTLHFAVVSLDVMPVSGRMSSAARRLLIEP